MKKNHTIKIFFLSIFSICLLLLGENLVAQSSLLPKNLGENINSKYDEFNPILSPDGKILYFIRANHPDNKFGKSDSQDAWYAEKKSDGTWSEAKRCPNVINASKYNGVLGVLNSGKTLLISGTYSKNRKRKGDYGITTVDIINEEVSTENATPKLSLFGKAKSLKAKKLNKKSRGASFNVFINDAETFMVLAATRKIGKEKLSLYVSFKKKEHWTKPRKLNKIINSGYSNEAPSIAGKTDEFLYFSSKRKNGKGGYDIYRAKRLDESWKNFDAPVLLGDTVNSIGYESYYRVHKATNTAYFTSNNNSKGGTDIFSLKLAEDNPFIVLYGKIINQSTLTALTNKKGYEILVNGIKNDAVTINYDSATYKAKLPLGTKYSFNVALENYISSDALIDVSSNKEFTVKNQNLFVTPLPYVLVSGYLKQKTGELIPSEAKPQITIYGLPLDSVVVSTTGSYNMRLLYGKKYPLSVKANRFTSEVDTLDLFKITEFKEIKKDLFANQVFVSKPKDTINPLPIATPKIENKVAIAYISGKVNDRKTWKPISRNVNFSVQVDKTSSNSRIDTSTSEYFLELPVGQVYVINAVAEKYYPVYETIDLTKEKSSVKILKDLQLVPIEVGQSVRMNNIVFESGKAVLKPSSYSELNILAKFLKENPTIKVEVQGHTDNIGKPDKNLQLSKLRAKSVKVYLEQQGVSTNNVTFNGLGATKPVTSNKTPYGRSINRRVVFIIKNT
jgi:outer membrane protein OmpA-like peptidoglycan-associated protein